MNKIHLLVVSSLVVLTAAAGSAAAYKYEHVDHGLTFSQVLSQRNDALQNAANEKALLVNEQSILAASQAQVTSLSNQKAAVCGQLTSLKLKNANCD